MWDELFQAPTSMIPSGSIPSGPPWSFELFERADFPLAGGKFDIRSGDLETLGPGGRPEDPITGGERTCQTPRAGTNYQLHP